jgi:hypothetical protein
MKSAGIRLLFACVAAVAWSARVRAQEVPELVFQKPVPVTMAELAGRTTPGVSATSVAKNTTVSWT